MIQPQGVLIRLKQVRPFIYGPTAIVWIYGLYQALILSPPDYQQGESVRLMYVHVPASWWAIGIYAIMAVCAAVRFVAQLPVGDLIVKSLAPMGLVMTALSLVTGSLWGKPMWGTYWAWDGRLTSMLILFFLYVGYIILSCAHDDAEKGLTVGSILVMIGAFNLPIIKWSVHWWHTLHQGPSVIRMGAPTIHGDMMVALLSMAAAYGMALFLIFVLRFEGEIARRRLYVLRGLARRLQKGDV